MSQTHITLATNVLATELPGSETVLLHLQQGEYYTLNESGSLIWQALQQTQDLAVVSERLAAYYQLSRTGATFYVVQLVEDLVAAELVHTL